MSLFTKADHEIIQSVTDAAREVEQAESRLMDAADRFYQAISKANAASIETNCDAPQSPQGLRRSRRFERLADELKFCKVMKERFVQSPGGEGE